MSSTTSRLFGTLTPAYLRDYPDGPAALVDWNDGKDFVVNNPLMSTYCSISDTSDCPVGHTMQLRWNKLTEVGVITKQADGTYAGVFITDKEDVEDESTSTAYPALSTSKKTRKPSIRTMMKWMDDGVAKATDGCRVEPDGTCQHGCKSWLLVLGLI